MECIFDLEVGITYLSFLLKCLLWFIHSISFHYICNTLENRDFEFIEYNLDASFWTKNLYLVSLLKCFNVVIHGGAQSRRSDHDIVFFLIYFLTAFYVCCIGKLTEKGDSKVIDNLQATVQRDSSTNLYFF